MEFLPTLDVADTVNTCIHMNSSSNNSLTSSNSHLMTKSPIQTLPQSPKPLSEYTLSPQHDLYMGHVISSPQPTSKSDTINID